MRVIAHRGFADIAPENTVSAIQSVGRRADAVEFDVRRCGSGELVVVHDETIDRVTEGTGLVADLSLEALQSYTVLDSGEPIPTLEDVLEAVPPHLELSVELKSSGIAADVLETIDGLENRVVLSSFLPSELRRVRDLDPDQPTGLLVGRTLEAPVTTAVELDCEVVGATYARCLGTRIVDRAHDVGLEISAWTVDRPVLARVLAWRGVDSVSADRPIGR
ncbi:glycerophosphodiester phosphodiesterase [Natrarchaeobaculum aegyptiacum]|uniref:Glycerophosphodiester phosphodiesterase n=1 Tax=Natrarchaeobaculum aegyptiacum TaxID=745377 RepID=A0A2Z2HV55_9EURY|nr:glycerophosphodiester phosphodiesterase family protein [Natrarchaeobaculum aegyptiacum]ARS91092.1 glycerophosphodiester phosphodiesterase [Natrarchaeobaculum aegyptiacum]